MHARFLHTNIILSSASSHRGVSVVRLNVKGQVCRCERMHTVCVRSGINTLSLLTPPVWPHFEQSIQIQVCKHVCMCTVYVSTMTHTLLSSSPLLQPNFVQPEFKSAWHYAVMVKLIIFSSLTKPVSSFTLSYCPLFQEDRGDDELQWSDSSCSRILTLHTETWYVGFNQIDSIFSFT